MTAGVALGLISILAGAAADGHGLVLRARDARRTPASGASASTKSADGPEGSVPTVTARSRGTGPLGEEERRRRNVAVQALVDADARATETPQTAEPVLLDALQGFADLAPLVGDAVAHRARILARLSLARTQLVLGRADDAAETMDETLRIARGDAVPVEQFGPDLEALHQERVAALEPAGRLVLRCHVPCLAWADERPLAPEGGALPAGVHRLWIEAEMIEEPVLRRRVVIPSGGELVVDFGEPAPEPVAVAARTDRPPAAPRRLLPRWASVLGLGLGVAAIGTGGVLVAVDHRCPDLSDPRTTPCPRILNTDVGGGVLLGVGVTALVTAALLLAVDEQRSRALR